MVEPLSVGVHAVRRAGVSPGKTVAIMGAGPIGRSACLCLSELLSEKSQDEVPFCLTSSKSVRGMTCMGMSVVALREESLVPLLLESCRLFSLCSGAVKNLDSSSGCSEPPCAAVHNFIQIKLSISMNMLQYSQGKLHLDVLI